MQNLVFYNANDPESFNIIYFNRQDLKFLVVKLFLEGLVNIVIYSYLIHLCSLRVFGPGNKKGWMIALRSTFLGQC